ncbi:MAG: hypothetical protein ACKOWF_07000 [Chloroflexota bacterium]
MDRERFDLIARALGGGASRRSAVGGILAAATAAVSANGLDARGGKGGKGGGKDKNRCGRPKAKCRDDRDCCTGYCRPGKDAGKGRCACITGGKTCTARQKCCAGFECRDGQCKKRGGPTPAPVSTGDPCTPSQTCASKSATCVAPSVGCPGTRCLLPLGQACEDASDCQSGACVEGVCASCSCPACLTVCTPTVCATCNYLTIQDAIDNAADGDVIDIAPGTYSENLSIEEKNLTLRGCTAGGPVILINDSYSTPTLYINSSVTTPVDVDLIDVTIKGYYYDDDDSYGGGITIYGGSLDLCGATTIDDCRDTYGGGVSGYNLNPDDSPGAVITMYDTTAIKNSLGTNFYGGGVYIYKNCEFHMRGSSTVTGNTNDYGGGVYAEKKCVVTMQDAASIIGNTSSDGGAGISISSSFASDVSRFEMSGCAVIAENIGGEGAGVLAAYTDIVISGTASIRDNEATSGQGGGIKFEANGSDYTVDLTISEGATVTGNTAVEGGGLYIATQAGATYTYSVGNAITGNTPDQCAGGATC